MNRKVLFVGTVLRGHILVFHLPYMKLMQEMGYEVHVCCRNDTPDPAPPIPYCDKFIELPFERSPFDKDNYKVYQQLKQLMEQEKYCLVHCNTPVGGLIGRLAARSIRRKGCRVVYTAHGFHFFRGSPLKNWLLFYPAERLLSFFTDLLITINSEDAAHARHFHARKSALVRGVGVDLTRFEHPADRNVMREACGIPSDVPVLITVGEHSPRKNQMVLLHAAARIPDVHIVLCGVGGLGKDLRALANELGISERTHFLGFRRDIPDLLSMSDVFVFPSLQEGLPVSQMEAMAAGLPCVVSDVRGNHDLISEGEGGFLAEPDDPEGFAEKIKAILSNHALAAEMAARNRVFIRDYSLESVLKEMEALYREQLEALPEEVRPCN